MKDHFKLIYDIGELKSLFVDSTSLESFLQKIVELISDSMHAEVCSIYLFYEDTQELVLKATKGLSSTAVGRVSLKLGEGLTGLAVKELRPVCEKNASHASGFRYFSDIGEERYESFLAVPILRGNIRIGAMVIQNSQKDYFDENDVKIFMAITSQLANTIETTKLLMSLNEGHKGQGIIPEQQLTFIQGKVGSEGFAFGEAVVLDNVCSSFDLRETIGDKQYTIEDFMWSIRSTEKELETLQEQIEERLSDAASLIFTAQILMLKDKGFINTIISQVEDRINPPVAIINTVERYVKMFEALPNEYLREKKHDVRDIGKRLLANLLNLSERTSDYANRIVIAEALYPSDILKLSSQDISGIILLSGGSTSHVSILARSLEIPLIITDARQLLRLPPKTKILLDAEQGDIYVNPSQDVIKSFETRRDDRIRGNRLEGLVREFTKTSDGTRIKLLSNINLLRDLKIAHVFKAEGVGLYRTEFPFIVRSDFPSEEEQFVIYKKVIEGMSGKEITFRTLDIGGDKILPYYDYGKEGNPLLGIRSIRFSLKHKDIFGQQIRAILRAGSNADLKIMFPMISSVDEFLEAKGEIQESIRYLHKKGIACHKNPKIGMMVELPAVLEIINELAQEADFFSIGTNDFIQYMLAVDRTNEKVADFYLPHHPSILRALKKIVDSAHFYKKDVTVCGDMAHDARYVSYFLGIGIRKYSLDPRYLPKIQKAIENINLDEAERAAGELLMQGRICNIDKMIRSKMDK